MQNLRLPKPSIFNFKESLWFLDRGYDDCLHEVSSTSVTKLLTFDQRDLLVRLSENEKDLKAEILLGEASASTEMEIKNYLTNWLDLDRDLQSLYRRVESFPLVGDLFQRYYGLRLIAIPDLFEALGWSIIGQQINLNFAYQLKRALVEKYGVSVTHEGMVYHRFPTPDRLAGLSVKALRALQYSRQKAEYLINLARLFIEARLSFGQMASMESTQDIIRELCKVRGVGEWTANYAVMKSLKRMDCITYGDIGLLNAIKNLKGLEEKPKRQMVEAFFKPFAGWESYVVFYLWRSLSPG